MNNFQKGYIPSLDGLRMLSITLVVFGHFYFDTKFPSLHLEAAHLGEFAVNIFFAISGYLITTLLIREKKKTGNISLKAFYLRRALRILPVAYLFLAFVFVLNLIITLNLQTRNFLMPAFFIENFNRLGYTATAHYWSLSVEEQYYLIFPLIIAFNKKVFIWISAIIIGLSPVIIFLYFHHYTPILNFLKDLVCSGMVTILTGSLTAIFHDNHNISDWMDKIKFPDMFIMAIFLLCISFAFYIKIPMGAGVIIESLLICTFIIFCITARKGLIFKFLNLKAIKYIGVLSYSIYIWQQIFTHDQPWAHQSSWADNRLLNFAALIIISWISYTLYESYFLRLKTKFKS